MNEAVDVFFNEMIEKDRYKPNLFLYNVIIKYCVYLKYTKLAFEIFEQVMFRDIYLSILVANNLFLSLKLTVTFILHTQKWTAY
jgi:pentatricopeptide repeat protein